MRRKNLDKSGGSSLLFIIFCIMMPDYKRMHFEIQRKGVTLSLLGENAVSSSPFLVFTNEKRFVKGVLSDVFSIEHKIAAH